MELLLQNVLVGVVVAGCVVFSAWRLMSPRLRLKTLDLVGPAMGLIGASGPITRLRADTLGKLVTGTCSACSSNKSAVHHPGRR
ncbi:MAG TPA: hypothetical protein VH209_17315 [Steroidobacteraceae bacterium]|jgi:hypothetical protein|nr:hypothetical protein [Steroidobacteraceae bacterium]